MEPRSLILEGLVTTRDVDGAMHVAPMGPRFDPPRDDRFLLRPFEGSQTLVNVSREGGGVFQVTDRVEWIARAAVHDWDCGPPPTLDDLCQLAPVLTDACRWWEFRVVAIDRSEPRARLECEVVSSGRLRDFQGFNRARHGVLEATIFATRVGILPDEAIREEFDRAAVLVEKTGGEGERRALEILRRYLSHAAGVARGST